MRLNDLRETSNVEDRRGGFGPGLAIGGGGLGLVGLYILATLFGVDPNQLLNGTGAPVEQTQPGQPRADDADLAFARKIVGSAEDVWTPILAAEGTSFAPATLTAYDGLAQTGCGWGEAAAGPFYCPQDNHIYLDLSFFNELSDRFGAPGRFAQAYVIAHEYGHHIQTLLGTMRAHQDGDTGAASNSVRIELQADCYAGVWTYRANAQFHILEQGDVEQGLQAASAVGDDTLEKRAQGYAVPDSFTHGTSEQRVRWFKRGLARGEIADCNTFDAERL